jgi:hypothetical protein
VAGPLTREQALRILQLPSTADVVAVKRAYRRLVREHHPDLGGDPGTFHDLQRAFERLRADEQTPARPRVVRGRPSRPHAGSQRPVDPGSVDWDTPLPSGRDRLDRDRLAVWLARDHHAPLHPVVAASRAPGSRLNALATMLAGDLSSSISVHLGTDDRGQDVLALEVRGSCRSARRALDRVPLEGTWIRHRSSNTTVLSSAVAPDGDRPTLAVRVVDRLHELLEALGWPLDEWRVVTEPS